MTRWPCVLAAAVLGGGWVWAGDAIYYRRDPDGTLVLTNVPDRRDLRVLRPATARYRPGSGERFRDLIARTAREHGVHPELVYAVAAVESSFDPRARSVKGAQGLMQLMPETAERFGVADPFDAAQNVRGGVRFLRHLLDLFEGDVRLALAAYNAWPRLSGGSGPGGSRTCPWTPETRSRPCRRPTLKAADAFRMGPDPGRPLAAVPKADLHLHLEGSIDLETLLLMRRRRGEPAGEAERRRLAALYAHRDFPHFLSNFRDLCAELKSPADFALATERLAGRLSGDNVRLAEVMCSATIFARRGLPAAEILDASWEAARRSAAAGGPRLRFLIDGVRQWGPEGLEEVVRTAQECRRFGVVGVGLGGDETAWPAAAFAPAFREARRLGLRTTAHAGEFDGPRSVWQAMEVLEVERIGHGVRAAEDQELVRVLAGRRLPLECCPTSNLKTRVVPAWDRHPVAALYRAGVRVTINSDDPALFGTSTLGEWEALEARAGLATAEVLAIGRETIGAAFFEEAERLSLLREFDASAPQGSA
jgi:aminodeoxyfutalosine deaminase